ncbi:bifunctional diguanylate cyclase/phosphohydrolase [Pelotomaculum propionicicum]|uniref:Cyclic di-GMP phosphodiesterase response regulator RpfG n=1 Tax=Pelotomaculum propionicicum TaxID=258475 RepID=A0A4Y7RV11_9FIRM|nr:diguanylate cyclase [Pelotomaculum propionicicum]TEB12711.1 Cyclic di-GMP phosphodiesterase response regulator RpfG [Pelotomaculum propionicicum]
MNNLTEKPEAVQNKSNGIFYRDVRLSLANTLPFVIGITVFVALYEVCRDSFYAYLSKPGVHIFSIILMALISCAFILWFYYFTKKRSNEVKAANDELLREIIMRNQTEERLKYLSFHDHLTCLYNRAFFEEQMQRFAGARFSPVSIIVCDVDGLKFVNDTLGHELGDALLVAAANIIKSSFDESDVVARTGGDEFAILLPNCDEKAAKKACDRITAELKSYNRENNELPLSISIGSATSCNQSSMNDLFKEADNNMYREKLHRSQSARSSIVHTLKKALGARDYITEGHADRMQDLVTDLAKSLSLPERKLADLRLLAQFHDIGKVGIPDSILFKPGPLSQEEYTEMKRHCEIGYIIAMSPPDLGPIADFILKHHEWWNGKGYPLGLKGEEIPLECRILAVADAYDAMTSDRPYRSALPRHRALAELKRCSGVQFDPFIVEKFVNLLAAS